MDGKNIVIDLNSLLSVKKEMLVECDSLIELINRYEEIIEETKRVYDTESGRLYREKAKEKIEKTKDYINSNFRAYIDKLDKIHKIYSNEINEIAAAIQGGAK